MRWCWDGPLIPFPWIHRKRMQHIPTTDPSQYTGHQNAPSPEVLKLQCTHRQDWLPPFLIRQHSKSLLWEQHSSSYSEWQSFACYYKMKRWVGCLSSWRQNPGAALHLSSQQALQPIRPLHPVFSASPRATACSSQPQPEPRPSTLFAFILILDSPVPFPFPKFLSSPTALLLRKALLNSSWPNISHSTLVY